MARPPSDPMFSDSDWTSDVPAAPERRDHRIVAALVAGVAIGALGATLVWWFATTLLRAPQPPAGPAVAATTPPVTAASAAIEAPPDAMSQPAAQVPAVAESASSPTAAAAAAEPPLAAPQQQAALSDEAARRKERAWRKFYQPPAICTEDKRGDFMVECANHSIRARKEFEERYATGRL